MHGNGKESISGSVAFLIRYEQEVNASQDREDNANIICCRNLFGDQVQQSPMVNYQSVVAPACWDG